MVYTTDLLMQTWYLASLYIIFTSLCPFYQNQFHVLPTKEFFLVPDQNLCFRFIKQRANFGYLSFRLSYLC